MAYGVTAHVLLCSAYAKYIKHTLYWHSMKSV